MDRPFDPDFRVLFSDRPANFPDKFEERSVRGLRVLITGAGGSIGSALAGRAAEAGADRLVLLDHSEQALFELRTRIGARPEASRCDFVLGDMRDGSFLTALLAEEKPDVIFHAAAFKHVPLLEENPFAAIHNNALATWNLARLAAKLRLRKLLLISTDKAANPLSMLGVSKRLAELAILRWNNAVSPMSALRLGNVAGSSGSVLPAFQLQIARGGPVTVTHPDATRYFLSMAETCTAIGALAAVDNASGIYLPEMGEPVSIRALAERMIQLAKNGASTDVAMQFSGLRPGDKIREDLLSNREALGAGIAIGIRQIHAEAVRADWLDAKFRQLEQAASARELAALLASLQEIVPEYRAGSVLTKRSAAAAGGGDD